MSFVVVRGSHSDAKSQVQVILLRIEWCQCRLVAMLAELGQRGGFLRLIGKVALLWGGLRGAMSLTDRLLGILHFNERPVHQRCAPVIQSITGVLVID